MRSDSRGGLTSNVRPLSPFILTALAAWVTVLFGTQISWPQYGMSVVLLTISWSYGVWASLVRGQSRAGMMLGSLGFLAAVAVLRNAAGGSGSGVSIVSLLAVFQTALFMRDRRSLLVVLAALPIFYLAPLVIIGLPEYPHSGYRSALLAVAVSSIVGLVTQDLVGNIRGRASESRRREHMLSRVNETLQELFLSPDPRRDACQAVKEISDAMVAGLFEPEPGTPLLTLSATTASPDAIPAHTVADQTSAIYEAFRSRQPLLINKDAGHRVTSVALWRAGGSPASVLYQPLLKGDVAVGVLYVGWSQVVALDETCVIIASLVAHEAAAVIDRADMIDRLTDDAQTDPLTGLPNRRAWDAQLELAMAGRAPLVVALLDIDHFKRYNDAHGHPAGDRLLREAAAEWRSQIRGEDFLARIGGEEFALLVTGTGVPTARAVVERVRAHTPSRQTCSAGIALRLGDETPEQLVNRADQALYEAKSAGRDRIMFTGDRSPGSS